MKSYYKKYSNQFKLISSILILLILSSCEMLEPEENFSIIVQNEDLPSLSVRFGESSDFNLSSSEGSIIDLILESNSETTTTIKIYATVNEVDGAAYEVSTVESIPAEITLDIQDIRAGVGEETNLENGDIIFLKFRGEVGGEDLQFNGTAVSSNIICNSMISTPEDTWHGEATADNGGSFPATASAEDVKIIPLENDQYLISDISAGWFEAIGFRDVQEGIYADNCNELTWIGTGENFQFNFADPEIQGNYDPITETLTIYWYEPGNDFRGESTFTKN
jgi:hypothetical protein